MTANILLAIKSIGGTHLASTQHKYLILMKHIKGKSFPAPVQGNVDL